MSDNKRDTAPPIESSTDHETLERKGRSEKQRNDSEIREAAEVKEAEQSAREADRDDPQSKPAPTPDELRGEIAEAREEIGDTVEALAAKADVKGQIKDKADDAKARAEQTKDRAQAKAGEAAGRAGENPAPLAAVAGGVLALVLAILLLRRRR